MGGSFVDGRARRYVRQSAFDQEQPQRMCGRCADGRLREGLSTQTGTLQILLHALDPHAGLARTRGCVNRSLSRRSRSAWQRGASFASIAAGDATRALALASEDFRLCPQNGGPAAAQAAKANAGTAIFCAQAMSHAMGYGPRQYYRAGHLVSGPKLGAS